MQRKLKIGFRSAWSVALMAGVPFAHAAADDAASYPNRPIRLVMPIGAGGSVDILGRILANRMGELMRQQIVIDNRAGAGGLIGVEIAKSAVPDGYTLLAGSVASMAISPQLQKSPPYDASRDFAHISLFAVTPNVLVVPPAVPARNIRELIELAKERGGKLNMASAGVGSQSHLAGVMFQIASGAASLHVPYKGGSATMQAVLSNEAQWLLTPAAAAMSYVRNGQLRALGHTLPRRSTLMGDIPPIADTVPGFSYSGWAGIAAPLGLPRPIIAKVNSTMAAALNTPKVQEAFAAQGAEIVTSSPEEFRKFVRDELERGAKLIKAAALKVE